MMLLAIRAIIDEVTRILIIATKHLFRFLYLDASELITEKELEDIPIIIFLEDVLHRQW